MCPPVQPRSVTDWLHMTVQHVWTPLPYIGCMCQQTYFEQIFLVLSGGCEWKRPKTRYSILTKQASLTSALRSFFFFFCFEDRNNSSPEKSLIRKNRQVCWRGSSCYRLRCDIKTEYFQSIVVRESFHFLSSISFFQSGHQYNLPAAIFRFGHTLQEQEHIFEQRIEADPFYHLLL